MHRERIGHLCEGIWPEQNREPCCPVAVQLLKNCAFPRLESGSFQLQDDISVIRCSCFPRATTANLSNAVPMVWKACSNP
ncbi:hypothetical protein TNCV_879201 [Trichonephila clavipes]|nr:hypothetical protein TNCV_879201 [Trichonephila clavipes]